MTISLLTAMIIKGNQVSVETFRGPDKKYGFRVSRMENGIYRVLLDTPPYCDTAKEARTDGNNIVAEIKGMDLEAKL